MGILYIPFIRIYTDGITDANYIRPMLALLFVIIGLVQNIRSPGITLICAAGHYSATQNRAILEALINRKRTIASTCSYASFSAIIVSHDTESKKLST